MVPDVWLKKQLKKDRNQLTFLMKLLLSFNTVKPCFNAAMTKRVIFKDLQSARESAFRHFHFSIKNNSNTLSMNDC